MHRQRRRRFPLVLAAGCLLAAVSACQSDDAAASKGSGSDAGKLVVVTSVSPLTNLAANIAGDKAKVVGLVPEGVNSHTFEPPPSAARTLAQADIVVINGLGLEDPTQQLADGNRKKGAETVRLGDNTIGPADYIYDFSFPKDEGKPNPHLWTNPPMARRYAEIIADTLARRDPANAATYRANLAALAAELDSLDAALRTATATVPPAQRKLLTYHDAYAYFAREYGWEVIGAIQPSDFEEPTAKDVANLIDQVRTLRLPAIFGSEVFPSKVLEQIGKETGARYVDSLRDDDLPGKPGEANHTLVALLRDNYVTVVTALGGDPAALKAVPTANVVPDQATYPQ